ncbi:MAG: UbiA family prenyltransferase [Desulfobacula sp.]|jgi:heme o synthase|nr:UbiA family prenyltransferase [Desulfobacula sp.]MBT7259739.1 UbiA family prenyltransferase [Desulfobacula sp.]
MNGNKISFSHARAPGFSYALKYYLSMFKLQLCIYISLSAILGHVMAGQRFSSASLLLGFFVMVLAFGSAVLNNVQDRAYDRFFQRTCYRSLPKKRVPVFHAKVIAVIMIGFGLSGLMFAKGFYPFVWGAVAVLCYNGLYTPLKKISLLAIIPGSLSGMLPPLIGWTAAGKSTLDFHILILMSIFGLWQIPHFFIILLKTRQTQTGTASLKRFPCFTSFFPQDEIKLQILIWTSLYSLAILLFLMNGSIKNPVLSSISGLNAVGVIFFISTIMLNQQAKTISIAFAAINLSMLLFMGAGICDKCFL